MQAALIATGLGGMGLTIISTLAERRRQRRANIEAVGFMPWSLLSILGVMVALYAFALGMKFA